MPRSGGVQVSQARRGACRWSKQAVRAGGQSGKGGGDVIHLRKGVVQVAAGTFVYVSVVDLLVPEFEPGPGPTQPGPHRGRLQYAKFAAFGGGFCMLSLLLSLVSHVH